MSPHFTQIGDQVSLTIIKTMKIVELYTKMAYGVILHALDSNSTYVICRNLSMFSERVITALQFVYK